MKKILFLFVVGLIAFFSCKKESINTEIVNETPRYVEKLILDFKAKLDATLKEGITYAVDSAEWYVEALLNYTYGNASVQCKDFNFNIAEISVNSSIMNGFTLEQLQTVFEYLENDVLTNQPENTNIYAIDVYAYPDNGQTVFAARTAYATPLNHQYKASMDTSGYWYWGAFQGMCGVDSGLYVGMDATHIIQNLINATGPSSDYFIDLETICTWGKDLAWEDPFFPFTDEYLMPRRVFYAYGPWENVLPFCLSPDHISYYTGSSGIPLVINSLRPYRKEFICLDVVGGAFLNMEVVHQVCITYGRRIN